RPAGLGIHELHEPADGNLRPPLQRVDDVQHVHGVADRETCTYEVGDVLVHQVGDDEEHVGWWLGSGVRGPSRRPGVDAVVGVDVGQPLPQCGQVPPSLHAPRPLDGRAGQAEREAVASCQCDVAEAEGDRLREVDLPGSPARHGPRDVEKQGGLHRLCHRVLAHEETALAHVGVVVQPPQVVSRLVRAPLRELDALALSAAAAPAVPPRAAAEGAGDAQSPQLLLEAGRDVDASATHPTWRHRPSSRSVASASRASALYVSRILCPRVGTSTASTSSYEAWNRPEMNACAWAARISIWPPRGLMPSCEASRHSVGAVTEPGWEAWSSLTTLSTTCEGTAMLALSSC